MRLAFFLYILIKLNFCFSQQNIQFTRFRVFDDSTEFDCSKPISLSFKPQHIGINFIDKSDTLNPQFVIKLEGSDNVNWIKIGNQGFMSYANLFGGNYELFVKNLRNNTQNSLKFSIKPAFWQSWWFIPFLFVYVVSVLGIIFYLFLQYKFRQKLRTQRIQDKIARDLHDDVGSTLSSIAILTQVAKNQLIDAPDKAKMLLNQISENAQEMLENMSDIVWTNKMLNDDFEQLSIRMQEFTAKLLEPKGIDYQFEIDKNLNVKWTSQRFYDFYMIFKESLNNAVKYSECNRLVINILKEDSSLKMIIQDDGKGFDLNEKISGNGIQNMHKRAESLKGKLEVKSEVGAGTCIVLTTRL
ncbi:MAG: histidine kinase [Spirosomataceae bacterium]